MWRDLENSAHFWFRCHRADFRERFCPQANSSQPPFHNPRPFRQGFGSTRLRPRHGTSPCRSDRALRPMATAPGHFHSTAEHVARISVPSLPLAAVSLFKTRYETTPALPGGVAPISRFLARSEADPRVQVSDSSSAAPGSTRSGLRTPHETGLRICGCDAAPPTGVCSPLSPMAFWPRSASIASNTPYGLVEVCRLAGSAPGSVRSPEFGGVLAQFSSVLRTLGIP